MMRTIQLEPRTSFSLEFGGNVHQNALCIADVDNDGENEIVIGNADGDLAIFKTKEGFEPWKKCSSLGDISAIAIGDLLNIGRNALVVITADGWCMVYDLSEIHSANSSLNPEGIFDINDTLENLDDMSLEIENKSGKTSSNQRNESGDRKSNNGHLAEDLGRDSASSGSIKPATEHSTAQSMSTTDLVGASGAKDRGKNNDGDSISRANSEVEVRKESGISEGTLSSDLRPILKQRLPSNIKEALIFDVNNDGENELILALTDRVVRVYCWKRPDHPGKVGHNRRKRGCLVGINKWEFGSQVGSVTKNRNSDGTNALIVAQPGGAFLKVKCQKNDCFGSELGDLNYEEFATHHMENLDVTSEIQGDLVNVRQKEVTDQSSPYAIVTFNGHIILAQNNLVNWKMKVNDRLFSVKKLDVNQDGNDEIIVSSWAGHTFVITQDGKANEFIFSESISAFSCGQLFVNERIQPVFVFVTFNGKIVVHFDIKLKPEGLESLLLLDEETRQLIRNCGLNVNTDEDLRVLNRSLLLSHSH